MQSVGSEFKFIFIVIASLFLSGCAIKHDYVWNEYPISKEKININSDFANNASVAVVKGSSSSEKIFLGNVGAHQYYGTEQSLTDAIVIQFAKEMASRGIKIEESSGKSVEITVDRSRFEQGMWKIAATLDFKVKLGNGIIKSFSVRNSSPTTVDRTYNGAIALAVIEIINDKEVLDYIKG